MNKVSTVALYLKTLIINPPCEKIHNIAETQRPVLNEYDEIWTMKVLVTGANGLLGANLVREFVKMGIEVKAFVRHAANLKGLQDVPCQLSRGDIQSYDDIYEALSDCDAAVHAASTTNVLPKDFKFYKEINFDPTKNIVQAALHQGNKRLVYVSTANVFGPGSKEHPATELSAFTLGHYKSGYINSKYMAQQHVLRSVDEHGLNAVIVNPTFIIGPFDVKPSSGKVILYGLKRGIQWCPPGGKNFVHVRDVTLGIYRAMNTGQNGHCYLLAGENLTYKEFFSQLNMVAVAHRSRFQVTIPKILMNLAGSVADVWARATNQSLAFNKTNAHLIGLDNYYDGEKAKRAFNLASTPIKNAIEEALTWFKKENYISESNYSTHGTNLDL